MDRTGSPVSVAATTLIGATEAVSYPANGYQSQSRSIGSESTRYTVCAAVYAFTSVAFVYDTYATDAGRFTSIAGCLYC